MAPSKTRKGAATAPLIESSSSEIETEPSQDASQSHSQSQTQELDTAHLTKIAQKHKEQAKARKDARMKDIQHQRTTRIAKIQKKMEECERKHEENLRDLRQPRIQQLRSLLQQKRELENEIAACHQVIDESAASTIQQIQTGVDDRLTDLTFEETAC